MEAPMKYDNLVTILLLLFIDRSRIMDANTYTKAEPGNPVRIVAPDENVPPNPSPKIHMAIPHNIATI